MNIHNTLLSSLVTLFAALALPTPALALQGSIVSSVLIVSVNSAPLPPPAKTGLFFGGCMAYLANPIASATPSVNCPGNWVSFSCDGTYASKEAAGLMLDQAQLAWATKRPVFVVVNDTKLHNGYCTANRFDIR